MRHYVLWIFAALSFLAAVYGTHTCSNSEAVRIGGIHLGSLCK